MNDCVLSAGARQQLRTKLNGLFEDQQLSDLAFRLRTNQDNLAEDRLEEIVNYVGQYVEETQKSLKAFINQHCLIEKMKRSTDKLKNKET